MDVGNEHFSFYFWEIGITLEDIYMLFGLPVDGEAVTFDDITVKNTRLYSWHDLHLQYEERLAVFIEVV